MSYDGTIRLACANMLDGGLGSDGATIRRDQTVAALREWEPHLVLVQEMLAPREDLLRRYWRALANAAGLEPVTLSLPRGSRQLRTGILADTAVIEILDDGPAPVPDAPPWAEAHVRVRATGTELTITSVHAPATSATLQRAEAERLATRTAQRGRLAIVGGDWNSYTPDGFSEEEDLSGLPRHLRPARTRLLPTGRLAANYDVHDILTAIGCADPVPALPADRRDPPHPPGTGAHPRARIDRFALWPADQMLPAVTHYRQAPNPGSDHHMIMITLSVAALARAAAPGPQP
jgi:hypothetical protein